jgi:hypothetical protein
MSNEPLDIQGQAENQSLEERVKKNLEARSILTALVKHKWIQCPCRPKGKDWTN